MLSPQTFATHLARAVELFRDPGAKDSQKMELRALMGLLRLSPVVLRAEDGKLSINGIVLEGVMYNSLLDRLAKHQVKEIALPSDAPPAEVFNLLKTLADEPSGDDVPKKLESTGTKRVTVEIARLFEEKEEELPPPPPPPPPPEAKAPEPDLGVEGILQGSIEEAPDPARRPSESLSRAVEAPPWALDPQMPPRATPDPQYSPIPSGPPSGPRRGVPSGVDELLERLEQGANLPSAGDTLVLLGEKLEAALKAKRQEEALRIVAGVVRVERLVPDAGPRRQYGIALKRMYTRPLFAMLVELLDAPRYAADAELALQRGGGDAVEILLERLAESPTVAERRRAFDVLARMKEAGSQLINMMGHPQWFVVRNVAELIGEMGLEDAVPALAKKIDHDDVRVRKAVALSLAKIGTRSVVEPLRRALRDPSPEVRTQAALGVGGRRANALAMPLVVALDEEKDLEVSRELILALGRIGSPDAVQALIKLAQPAGGFFGKKPVGLRLAAIEALRLAATPAALGILQNLLTDSDKQIKAAAQAAAHEIKGRA